MRGMGGGDKGAMEQSTLKVARLKAQPRPTTGGPRADRGSAPPVAPVAPPRASPPTPTHPVGPPPLPPPTPFTPPPPQALAGALRWFPNLAGLARGANDRQVCVCVCVLAGGERYAL